MTDFDIVGDGTDIFVVHDGVQIAKRGHPGTPQSGTWVSLVPGWTVTSDDDHTEIRVTYEMPQ